MFFIVLSAVIAMDPLYIHRTADGNFPGEHFAGAFLAPFMYGLHWERRQELLHGPALCYGVGITVLNLFFHFIASLINAGAVAMVAGLIVVPGSECAYTKA